MFHRGTTMFHRGTTMFHRGTTILHRGTTILHRGTTILHRGTTRVHRGTTMFHRGTTRVHRGMTMVLVGGFRLWVVCWGVVIRLCKLKISFWGGNVQYTVLMAIWLRFPVKGFENDLVVLENVWFILCSILYINAHYIWDIQYEIPYFVVGFFSLKIFFCVGDYQ